MLIYDIEITPSEDAAYKPVIKRYDMIINAELEINIKEF